MFNENYDRVPFGFSHNLHRLALFENETLRSLCETYATHPEDYFVSRSALTAGAMFYSVPTTPLKPHEAFDQLTAGSYKILLKRLERHHDGFRDLLNTLFGASKGAIATQSGSRRGRAAGIIGLHQLAAGDDAVPFRPRSQFLQPRSKGEKVYHLYAPSELAEDEVEPLYVRATTDIGQVDLGRRDPSAEHVFRLQPGLGFAPTPRCATLGRDSRIALDLLYVRVRDPRRPKAVACALLQCLSAAPSP